MRGNALRPPSLASLRAPFGAFVLSAIVMLQAEATIAPSAAVEATLASAGRATAPMPTLPLVGDIVPPRIEGAAGNPAANPRPAATTAEGARFQAALDAARAAAGAYGVTFAAVRDGQVIWAGSSGRMRDGRTDLHPDDPMVIGSVTKTFVAATVMQLVEEGRLRLDDPVRKHLPELRGIVSPKITVRQLLDHTSGLADLFNDTTRRGLEEHPERAWTSTEVLRTLHAPWYRPGEGWAYANTNYRLLAMIVERVTGEPLESEVGRRFLGPLALESTRMLTATDGAGPLSPAWATIFWGSGAMSASAPDLARWGDALLDGSLLSAETRTQMRHVNRHDYALGLQRIELARRVGYGHTGLLNTYTTLLLHLPNDNVTIAMLVNRTDVDLRGMLIKRPDAGGPSLLRLAIGS